MFPVLFPTVGTRGAAWTDVTAPDAAFSFVPFTIQQNGRSFRPATTWNLQTHANISVTTTYYVDKATGNNGNTGLSWAQALADIKTALQKADVDRIYVKAGYYHQTEARGDLVPDRSLEIIAVDGPVYMTSSVGNRFTTGWTLDSNHYEATIDGNTLSDVWDNGTLDSFGNATRLTKKASEAEVDGDPGSWWQSGNTVFVRLEDGRSPDSNVFWYQASNAITVARNSRTYYFEGIHFHGGIYGARVSNLSATGGLKAYFKDCAFRYIWNKDVFLIEGADEVILQNCIASHGTTLDGFHYDALNTVVPDVIEIDCESYEHGSSTSHQASSVHGGINIVRIGGYYHHTTDHNIRDIGGGKMWCLGTEVSHSDTGKGFAFSGTAWLDSCYSHDNPVYDLVVEATCYIRDFVSGGNFSGTPTAY